MELPVREMFMSWKMFRLKDTGVTNFSTKETSWYYCKNDSDV
jgi:hypothetical protein